MTTGSALIGRTLGGRFRVTGFIGEGAMACVYRGVQEADPRDVAIKVMHPHLSSDRTFVGRFRREAKAAAQIHHPNSVQIFDTGVDEKLLYIAMELLAGQDLFEILALERRLSEARAARILVEVAAALTAAHERGIVHRDLKPENVMLLRDPASGAGERVKVLDFGIAKILEREIPEIDGVPKSSSSLTALTNVGMVVGTPAYMSPEQCRGEAVDARSDVYACGILLYQLVTGRLPFVGNTAMDYAVMHVRTKPTPPHEITPGIHLELEALVLKALAKFPTDRQQSAEELAAELRRLGPDLATAPFEDKRPSVGPLRLSSSSGGYVRHHTPEPVTRRRQDTPTREVYRTLPSERKLLESARPGRAAPIESDADLTRTNPIPPRIDELGPARDRVITIKIQRDEAKPKPVSDPPPSSFEVFDRPTLDEDDGDDATRPNRAVPVPSDEEAPTPLSRPLAAGVAYEEPETPPRSAPRAPEPAPKAEAEPKPEPKPRRLARRSRPAEDPRAWLVVPLALAVGLALGTLLFFLLR